MSFRRGPKQRYTIQDHLAVVEKVNAFFERHPDATILSALAELRISESRYQYARERIKLAKSMGQISMSADSRRDPPVVHSEAYAPTRCQECESARARSMWAQRAVCAGCYDKLKADWNHRAGDAQASQPEDDRKEEMEAKASRVVPMLTNPEAEEADEQESEETSEDEDGILDGMELEFEDDADGQAQVASDGEQLVRVFVIEGTVDAVAAILERRFG